MKIHGKTVLITGAAKRVGREIALVLARRGANILLHYNHSRKEALALKREIESFGGTAALIQADFSKPKLGPVIRRFVKEASRLSPVDVLVNNASVFYPTPLAKITERDWDDNLAANLKAPFFLAREFGLRMKKRGAGKIINILDATIFRPSATFLPYMISKAGLYCATAGLARALAPEVQVAGVGPGPVVPARGSTKKQRDAAAKRTLLKRFGDPKDIAATVRFLIEDTDFITGAMIPVDGGAAIA